MNPSSGHRMPKSPYLRFFAMVALHFVAMVALMYSMVDRYANVFLNANQLYMAGLMSASMVVIELALMSSMYPNKKLNAVLAGLGVASLVVCWVLTRQQLGIGDEQFLKSMIPHHAGAILMCKEAEIDDPDIEALCDEIVATQRTEIAQMKAKLRER